MKIIRMLSVTVLLFLASSFVESPVDTIQWISISEAEKLNKKKPKKILVDVYTDWCGWCKKLDATTYKDPAVVAYINENYYAVKYNAEQKEPITFRGKTYTYDAARRTNSLNSVLMGNSTGYPTTTFLDEELEVIMVVPGYLQTPMMNNILKYIGEDHYKSTDWNSYLSANQPKN